MPSAFLTAIVWAIVPVACLVVSGLIAFRHPPGAKLRSGILHFAAGVVFSVTAVELLPDVVRRHVPWHVALGFSIGVLAMFTIRTFAKKAEKGILDGSGAIPWGMVVGVGVDVLVDGLLLGIVFAAGPKAGLLLALALAVELVSLGLAMGSQLANERLAFRTAAGLLAGTALAFFAGTAGSVLFTSLLSADALDVFLAFGLAALMYLVTEELLVEAHEEGRAGGSRCRSSAASSPSSSLAWWPSDSAPGHGRSAPMQSAGPREGSFCGALGLRGAFYKRGYPRGEPNAPK